MRYAIPLMCIALALTLIFSAQEAEDVPQPAVTPEAMEAPAGMAAAAT